MAQPLQRGGARTAPGVPLALPAGLHLPGLPRYACWCAHRGLVALLMIFISIYTSIYWNRTLSSRRQHKRPFIVPSPPARTRTQTWLSCTSGPITSWPTCVSSCRSKRSCSRRESTSSAAAGCDDNNQVSVASIIEHAQAFLFLVSLMILSQNLHLDFYTHLRTTSFYTHLRTTRCNQLWVRTKSGYERRNSHVTLSLLGARGVS